METTNFLRPEYKDWTPAQVYQHFRTRANIEYFPVLDAAETRPEKITAVLENRFTFNNETHALAREFDWKVNPSQDMEWLIMLHKFYYAAGLGKYYLETGQQKYVSKWVELTSSWIDAVEPGFIASDVTGRRIQNWIFAHYYFVSKSPAACVAPDFYLKFLRSIYEQVSYLGEHLTPSRNHRTLELYAIFLAAVVFQEFEEAAQWLEFAQTEIYKNIREDVLEDGVHCELSTDYHHIVLRNYLGVRRLAQLNQIPFDPEADRRIEQALEFAMYAHKPDGCIPSLSDGDSGSFLYLLQQGYELYGREDMLYAATRGEKGEPPAQRSRSFNRSGYHVLRSGWGDRSLPYADEHYLIFDCGPLGRGNHGHFDLLSFEMAACGKSLIVDPGRFTYDESGDYNWRVHFRGTQSHNTVLVDQKDQTRYCFNQARNKFKISGPEPEYKTKMVVHRSEFDFLHGVARSHEYGAVHERRIFYACPDYWIITDFLRDQCSHRYDLLFHLSPQANGRVALHLAESTLRVESPNLVLAQPFQAEVEVRIEKGYVSPTYGVKQEAPVLRFTQTAKRAAYLTLLVPFKFTPPEILIEQLDVFTESGLCARDEVTAIRVTWNRQNQEFKDYYFNAYRQESETYRFEEFVYEGKFFFVRKDADGNIVRVHHQAGTLLKIRKREPQAAVYD